MKQIRSTPKRSNKKNNRYGDLVRKVVAMSGRSAPTVYAVLHGRMRSRPVQDAIDQYYRSQEIRIAADARGSRS